MVQILYSEKKKEEGRKKKGKRKKKGEKKGKKGRTRKRKEKKEEEKKEERTGNKEDIFPRKDSCLNLQVRIAFFSFLLCFFNCGTFLNMKSLWFT